MAVKNPEKVPTKKISSLDITGFSGGLYLNSPQNAESNQIIEGVDVELSSEGLLQPRRSRQTWLPPTVESVHEIFPALIEIDGYADTGKIHFFTLDDGKMKYCLEEDTSWTDCGGGAVNDFVSDAGGKCTFIRAMDSLLILNGGNGDKLAYIDLTTSSFAAVKYALVADPTSALTAAATGITTSGAYKIYYGYTYSSATGETKLNNILTQTISKPRDQWDQDGTEYLTLTRPSFGSEPAGSTYWNLYVALASSGGTIQDSDMLMLAGGLDLAQEKVVDNGTLSIDIGRGNPPTVNTTDGPIVKHGIEADGRPILFGDGHNIHIGGDGEYALDFSSANGGYRSEPSRGTNYYPASVFGFRNGQGIPSLTILFSNTQGLSKQATLEQQTITYGNQSFVVWGVTEQNYGAAGVASALGVVNYKGQASFPSTDGFTVMDTQPQLQNVVSTRNIDKDIKPYTRRIKVSALAEIVGAAWDDKIQWLVPAAGFDTPNEILVRDLNNNGSWYTMSIAAQWIGVVSPPDSPAFVYLCQGNQVMKLFDSFGTVDFLADGASTFPTSAKSGLIGLNDAHNQYQAVVQAVFYILDIIGDVTVGVTYRNQNGKLKTRRKTFNGPQYVRSSSGGWSDSQYVYSGFDTPAGWDEVSQLDITTSVLARQDKRIVIPINDLASEIQWFIETPDDYCDYKLRAVSFEGENLGVKPDLV